MDEIINELTQISDASMLYINNRFDKVKKYIDIFHSPKHH